jgi:hypothetical protein
LGFSRGPWLTLEVIVAIVRGNREYRGKKWGADPEPKMNYYKFAPNLMFVLVNETFALRGAILPCRGAML